MAEQPKAKRSTAPPIAPAPKSIPLRKFLLVFYYSNNHRHRSLFSSWLRYALACNADDVELNFVVQPIRIDRENCEAEKYFSMNDPKSLYDFHFSDLRNRVVKCLSLCYCQIIMPSNDSIRFVSLRVLTLTHVEIVDDSLSDLILRCENLERLILHDFRRLRKFRISSETLKFLELSSNPVEDAEDLESSIEIRTPNLSRIGIFDFVANYSGNLSSVVEAEVLFSSMTEHSDKCWSNAIKLLSGVENLNIGTIFSMYFYAKVQRQPYECFEFKRLKHLELMIGYSLCEMLGDGSVFFV